MRYYLLLAAFWFVAISAVLIQAGPAKADPVDRYIGVYGTTICGLLDRAPSFNSITRLGNAITNDGFGDQAGEILVDAVVGLCPQHLPLLQAYAAVHNTHTTAVSGRIGGRIA